MAAAEATDITLQSDEELFRAIESYPWNDDAEFQAGLAAILGPNTDPQMVGRLTLRARCFYYSRKNGNVPVDFPAYVAWHSSNSQASGADGAIAPHPTESQMRPTEATVEDVLSTSDEPPPYPLSFQQIVELISTGKPVPGIREIPDTLLEGQSTASTQQRRKKPWEKTENGGVDGDGESDRNVSSTESDAVNNSLQATT